ncbi:unnamed protein product [Arabis nemorensis]|uniref:MATH domain-containing protein n=1 Tax=Arabis nemorensis TaxID=586526 RepID=A0A565BXM5_9BRAS|nr:unnamed protein product [Arabis nemorensis]
MQELEEELKGFKQKYSDIEALLEKKKEELKDLKQKCSDTEVLLKKEKAKTKLNNDGDVSSHKETSSVKETIDVNGFQVLPSQVDSVKRIFKKHPNMASEIRTKNQDLRTSCMNVLLNLIKTMCQSLQDLSIDDLGQADNAITYLKISGFKVDWLERKLEEVKEKKMEEEIGETRMQELEKELKGFKQKYSDIEALLEKKKEELKDLKKKCSDTEALLKKEKAKVLAAKAPPLTLDDVV